MQISTQASETDDGFCLPHSLYTYCVIGLNAWHCDVAFHRGRVIVIDICATRWVRSLVSLNGSENNTSEWCRKLLLKLLDVRPHFREGFRIASANTAAASANASSKNLLPRASAAPFLSYFFAISLPRTERELPRSMWE